jgi:hypothetical protein
LYDDAHTTPENVPSTRFRFCDAVPAEKFQRISDMTAENVACDLA